MAQAGKAGKAGKTGKAGKAEKTTPEGELLFGILVDMLLMLHRVRALGRRQGAVSRWGGGTWGVLRSLAEEGPQTVPQLARARPVARQRIQKLADEMAADGLVEFVDNPAHRRSKLLRLTAAGFKRSVLRSGSGWQRRNVLRSALVFGSRKRVSSAEPWQPFLKTDSRPQAKRRCGTRAQRPPQA